MKPDTGDLINYSRSGEQIFYLKYRQTDLIRNQVYRWTGMGWRLKV
jgi:hypothetical protein